MKIDPKLYEVYSKEVVDAAIAKLTYKNAGVLPKDENPDKPILYVFRHGQSQDNEEFLFSGWRDAKLTKKGEEQALALAEKLKDKKIDMLITSDQLRAYQTMQLAMSLNEHAKQLEILRDPRIKERSYGDLQGTSKLELFLKDPKLTESYRRNYDVVPPNGESLAMVVKRAYEFIEEIVPKMKEFNINVAVSCHSNSIRGFRQYFEHLTNEQTALVETPLAQDYAAYSIS